MSVRRTGPRVVLPGTVRRAAVLDGLDGWSEGLHRVGVEVSLDGGVPDLAVARAASVPAAVASGAPMLLFEGWAPRRLLHGSGISVRRYLVLPTREDPELLLPLGDRAAIRYAIRHWRPASGLRESARNRLAEELLARGGTPGLGEIVTVAAREHGPLPLAAAERAGVPPGAGWFVSFGAGDGEDVRDVFHVFPPGAAAPAFVLKLARIRDFAAPFDLEQRGLELALDAGGAVAAHAPRQLGRVVVDGVHAALHTAAAGERLDVFLASARSRAYKLEVLGRVADWAIEVARTTAAPAPLLDGERARLEHEVAPRWPSYGLGGLPGRLQDVPAVFQHNDLYAQHLIVDGDDFCALDWETACPHALPLWDLLFLLADALPRLDGALRGTERERHFAALFRGELESSRFLFRSVGRAVETLGIPADSVGAIATLLWAHHGLEPGAATPVDPEGPLDQLPVKARLARLWLSDPGLGTGWSAWRP